MGCILEFLFELVFEGIFELIGYCYIKLMMLIVPDKPITENTKNKIKKIVTSFSAILVIVLIVGLILFAQDDMVVKNIGKCMMYIPLGIIGLQILLGIIMKIVNRIR